MSENNKIQCEYSVTRSNETKCKALEIEFHNCLNILEQKKCPIYKLKQQLKSKEQEIKLAKEMLIQNDYTTNNKTLPQIIEDFMSDNLLDAQNDEEYTIPVFIQVENKLETLEDLERECEKLKTQILSLQTMEIEENKKLKQECEELKEELKMNQNFVRDGSIESTALCKILEKYKQALDEIEEITGGTYYETEQTVKFKMQDIQDIINRTKE